MKKKNQRKNDNDVLELKEELEDVKREKEMTFEQTGLHVWSNQVVEQFQEFEEEIDILQEKIVQEEKKKK